VESFSRHRGTKVPLSPPEIYDIMDDEPALPRRAVPPDREAGSQLPDRGGERQPGAVTYDRDGHVVNVFGLDIADGMVQAIRCVANPDSRDTSAG